MTHLSRLTTSTSWGIVAASCLDLPDPLSVRIDSTAIELHLSSLADLAEWAKAAEATIGQGRPRRYSDTDRWTIAHTATGSIHDLPLSMTALEWGVMTEPDHFECGRCGAAFGVSGGFVADGTYDDHFETEVQRHQSGDCVFLGAPA